LLVAVIEGNMKPNIDIIRIGMIMNVAKSIFAFQKSRRSFRAMRNVMYRL
jgi:hypothetical protein